MVKPLVYVINGLGIGCHKEVADAFERAGANAEIVHYRQLLEGGKDFLNKSQILNFSGGFLHGDIPEAGLSAASELEHSGIKDDLIRYAEKNVIYAECNGFQLLVKIKLLPGIDNDYSKQTVTLAGNDCGNYFVGFVPHKVEKKEHFAFKDVGESYLNLWCRHGEGKIQFYSPFGSVSKEDAEENRRKVNENHVLLRYIKPSTGEMTLEFPDNPNGSVDGIAGLVNSNGHIIGHMAHTEVGIYASRDPSWFIVKDILRRQGVKAKDLYGKRLEGECLKVFENIVNYVK